MTEPTPAATQTPPAAVPPAPTPPPAAEKQPPWGKPENFDADKAWDLIQNLRSERKSPDPQLRTELDNIKQQQAAQRDAFASALGIKPEETSDTAKLAEQLNALKEQVATSQRRAQVLEVASTHKIPQEYHHLLTAPDAEGLKKQAEGLVEFAKAAAAATAPPAFQANPGQGQGNAPATPEAQAAAEYEKYYPSAPKR